jgi:hypothetical protein
MKTQPFYEAVCERKSVPPLSQSRYGDMACETLYVQKHVKGAILGESEPAARGIESHQVLANYINHLVRTERGTDLEVFEALMQGAGDEAERQNSKMLKDLMLQQGLIRYRDGNQTEHLAEFVPVEKKFYPYRDAVSILDEWFSAHSDEQGLRDKLTVSGLSSALKAEKRAELAQKLAGVADVVFEIKLRIGRVRNNASKEQPAKVES